MKAKIQIEMESWISNISLASTAQGAGQNQKKSQLIKSIGFGRVEEWKYCFVAKKAVRKLKENKNWIWEFSRTSFYSSTTKWYVQEVPLYTKLKLSSIVVTNHS